MSNAASVSQDDRLINVDVLGAVRRRKWIGLVVAALGITATVTVLNIWPSTYQSISTILIEEPDVPADLVKATVSTFANDRLQVIQQRVMTSQHLFDIIKEFNLYPDKQQGMPRSALINLMRSNVDLALVSADISGQQPQQQRPQPQASIAFTLAFSDQDANVAQHVAMRLTDLFLGENDRSRQQRAAGTTQFLGEQATKLYSDVQELEKRLLDLRSKYNGSLPEQFSMNTQLLNQAQSQLMMNQADLQSLMDKKSYLQSQLGTISPYTPMTSNGIPATPQAQLMQLELQYSDLSGRYGTKHPDVVRLQRQIEVMKQQIGGVDTRGVNEAKYSTLQAQLSDALQRYGEKHPEVQRLRRQLNELKAQMKAEAKSSSAFTAPQGPPDNPMYIQTQNQLADVDAQIRGINERTNALQTNIEDLQKRILQTPTVEAEYTSLENQHQAALQRYQTFKDKEADAQVAQTMEQQSKGETFSVIDPPAFPDTPASPNRKLLMAVGFLMSAMLAVAAMIGIDMLDPRIYEPKSLMQAFGEMPLATVPYIRTSDELRGRRLRMIGVASIAVILMAGILAFGLPIF